MKFSANLGFLWADRPLPDAIRAAAAAGFDAVECHWPYDTPPAQIRTALRETGLPMLGLNTRRGDVAAGEFGLAALPDRAQEARDAVDEALAFASEIGARAVHVMAGNATGPEADRAFLTTLDHACAAAARGGEAGREITILIEPLNRHDAPGYFVRRTDQARAIIETLGAPNLKLMFDCYHVGRGEGDVVTRLAALLPVLGHVQIAAVPDRGPPDHGDLDYASVFRALADLGWTRPVGAEYRSPLPTDETLNWLARHRR